MSNLVRGSISVFPLSLCLSRVVKTGAGQFASKAHTDPIEPHRGKGQGTRDRLRMGTHSGMSHPGAPTLGAQPGRHRKIPEPTDVEDRSIRLSLWF
jgi:hypothetical protein